MELLGILGCGAIWIVPIVGWALAGRFFKLSRWVKVGIYACLALFVFASLSWATAVFLDEALFFAADEGDIPKIHRLLSIGADPNSDVEFGHPLCAAVKSGHLEAARILLDAGANPIGPCYESDTLHLARANKDVKMLELLQSRTH